MLSTEVATALVAQGFGTLNTNMFYDTVPDNPDVVTSVLEYLSGLADEPNLGSGGTLTRLEYPRFQVITRGIQRDNDTPKLKLINIRAYLVSVVGINLSGVRYVGIDCLGPPFFLKEDLNFRRYFACNFQAIKVPSTS